MNIRTVPAQRPRLASLIIVSLAIVANVCHLPAQTAAAPTVAPQPPKEEEIIMLSPFVVSSTAEKGYLATDSQMGGRLNTPLNETAAAISVITRDFLDDLGIFNFTDAAGWTPNVVSDYEVSGENQFNDYNARFRGLSINAQSRNFFEWVVNSDSYNTERIDFSRGPNAVVFGTADIGGVGNVTTKTPKGKEAYMLRFITSEFGGYRVEGDFNKPISKNLQFRLNVLHEDLKGWRDYEKRERDGFHLATKYNFNKALSVTAEYEYGKVNRTILSRGVFNGYDGWDRTTYVTAPLTAAPATTTGISRRTTDYLYYAPGTGNQILNERNLGSTNAGNVVAQMLTTPRPETGWKADVVTPGGSHAHHFFAPNTNARNPYHTYSLFANYNPIKDLYIEAAYNHQEQERFVDQLVWQAIGVDVNQVRADGTPNPYVGQFYADSNTVVQNQRNVIDEGRLAAAYLMNSKLTDQNVLLMVGKRVNDFYLDQSLFVRTDAARGNLDFTNGVNSIRNRRYISLLDEEWGVPTVAPTDTVQARWVKTQDRMTRGQVEYIQMALAGKWLPSRKLSTTIGARRDRSGPGGSRSASIDPITKEVLLLNPYVENPSTNVRAFTTKTAGMVYKITDAISAYASYAESFNNVASATDINGNLMDPEVNKGKEVGLRVNLFQSKLSATATYYDNERTNKRVAGSANDINPIWSDLGISQSVPVGYSDTSSDKGNGYEFEIVGRIVSGWNISANYSLPEAIQTKGLTFTKQYYEANIAAWNAGAATVVDTPTRDRILQNILDVKNNIDSFPEGRKLRNSLDYTANVLTSYRFQEGRLKGAWVSGGVQMRGRRVVSSNNVSVTAPDFYADGYETYTLGFGYEGKLTAMRYKIQVNISNLLDTEIVRPTRFENFTVNGVVTPLVRNYTILDPRKIQLTTQFNF